jgi:hypothetical protein
MVMLHKLRIAFSVLCGIICVLLIAFWVRSYFCHEELVVTVPIKRGVQVNILQTYSGVLTISSLSQMGGIIYSDVSYQRSSKAYELDDISHSPIFKPRLFSGLAIHFWFLVLIVAVLTAIPWIRWSNRFSLRALLIAITLASVLLGAIVFAVR